MNALRMGSWVWARNVDTCPARRADMQRVLARLGPGLFAALLPLLAAWPAQAETCVEFRIRWVAYEDAPAHVRPGASVAANRFILFERSLRPGGPPLQRSREIFEEGLVIVALDSEGGEVGRTQIPDPRVMRAEFPTGTGKLQGGELFHRSVVEFSISFPDDRSIPTVVTNGTGSRVRWSVPALRRDARRPHLVL